MGGDLQHPRSITKNLDHGRNCPKTQSEDVERMDKNGVSKKLRVKPSTGGREEKAPIDCEVA